MKRTARWFGAIVFALASFSAFAGGPLSVCNGLGIKYPGAGTVNLNYDLGPLGARTKAQADALVTSSVSLWTNVSTATVTLGRGADLSSDATSLNFSTFWNSFNDGLNPVMYDNDGLIIDSLFGVNAKRSVLGVAGSAYNIFPDHCEYAEGRAVINGFLVVSDAMMSTTIAHEVGHLIGLDHTQLDDSQGLASSNFPLMYPIAYRSVASLHPDDAAAVSALYPDATLNSAYGQLAGTFTQADGTPIRGANLWAQGTGGVFSIVSDYLQQNTGYFKLLVPPGTYTLHAEAISNSFTGGSSVGPYAEVLTDPSFQPPLYVGGVPMAPVTLGNASPVQIIVTAGCSGTIAFKLDGSGSVGGDCSGTKSAITSPVPGSTLTGSTVTFAWTAGSNIADRYLMVGTTLGGTDIYQGYQGAALSHTVTGIPTNGATIYVRLMSYINGWQINDYTYTAMAGAPAVKSAITTPTPGSTLAGSTVTFAWTAGSGIANRYLMVGTTPGGSDIYAAYQDAALSATVSGIPTNGSTVYVRLMSYINGWQINDYTYTAMMAAVPVKSDITSPVPGSTLGGTTVTFAWNAGSGIANRYLMVGTTPGGSDIYAAYQDAALSATVSGIPTNGSTVYVRLMSYINGWQINDYTYTASAGSTPVKSVITSPTPGDTFTSSTVTFAWTAGNLVANRYLMVGTTLGGTDIYQGYQDAATSRTVSGLPTNGATIYVRLMSYINGWQINDYTYTATGGGPVKSAITSPTPGSTLSGSSTTFNWTFGSGIADRYLMVGTTLGGTDIYQGYQGAATSRTVTGMPTSGVTIYVRLMSYINGWQINDYTYRSGP